MEGKFRVELLFLNQAGDFIDEHGVLEHEQVRVKDAGVFGAHGVAHLALDVEDSLPSPGECLFQALNFLGHLPCGNFIMGYRLPAVAEHDNFSAPDTAGNRDAAQDPLP